jgi:hypothetical protein
MSITIEHPTTEAELTEFCTFADEVNAGRTAYWAAMPDMQLPLLKEEGPAAEGRRVLPLVARQNGRTVARVAAVVDDRYIQHWQERLGHLVLFEALPGSVDAVRLLMDEASGWLRGHGLEAARTGFGPSLDLPYVIDEYELLPPISTRQNPPYYHSLLKEARFVTEKGWVDYKIEVTPELVERWEHMVAGAEAAGFLIAPMIEVPEDRRVADFTTVWEDAFQRHWGFTPSSEAEWQEIFDFAGPIGAYDLSVLAYRDGVPVGVVLGLPDLTGMAILAEGRELSEAEKLNMLGIGVLESARGRGVNLAVAARCYLELAKRGETHVSYTLVVDDNWPSRRTAEKLGAGVCANYVVYRREFRPSTANT